MAKWVETNVNGYNVYAYDGNDWVAVNKTYAYWGSTPVQNEWYAYTDSTNTVIKGLTAKLSNPSDMSSVVFDSTYGWGQSSYIISSSVVDIDKDAFVNYYDKGGTTAITGLPLAPPTQQCELYLHDGMSFSRTGSDRLFSGYPPLNKIRFPNNFTGLNNDGYVFALFSGNPQNVALSTLAELVIPPNFVAITSDNFGSGGFSREFFPSFKKVKIMRKTAPSAINFVNLSFWGTAMWNWDLGSLGNADAIASDFEIYLDFDESEISSKINFNTAAPDTDLTTFKGVFNYLKSDGRVYFNQTITND
ncbi:MAG: hypothetical protein IJ583_04010 [Firmicutes bacterium]|nr:hypothetical protein [Bacillota bacterium]